MEVSEPIKDYEGPKISAVSRKRGNGSYNVFIVKMTE